MKTPFENGKETAISARTKIFKRSSQAFEVGLE